MKYEEFASLNRNLVKLADEVLVVAKRVFGEGKEWEDVKEIRRIASKFVSKKTFEDYKLTLGKTFDRVIKKRKKELEELKEMLVGYKKLEKEQNKKSLKEEILNLTNN